jgi:hypothetical protein
MAETHDDLQNYQCLLLISKYCNIHRIYSEYFVNHRGFQPLGQYRQHKKQAEKATKSMFEVLKRGRTHNLSIECQLELLKKNGKTNINHCNKG